MTLYDAMKIQGILQEIVKGSETLVKKDVDGNLEKDEEGFPITYPPKYHLSFNAKYAIAKTDKAILQEADLYRETKKKEFMVTFGSSYEDADQETKVKMDADFVKTASTIEVTTEIPKIKEDVFASAELPYEFVRILLPILE